MSRKSAQLEAQHNLLLVINTTTYNLKRKIACLCVINAGGAVIEVCNACFISIDELK